MLLVLCSTAFCYFVSCNLYSLPISQKPQILSTQIFLSENTLVEIALQNIVKRQNTHPHLSTDFSQSYYHFGVHPQISILPMFSVVKKCKTHIAVNPEKYCYTFANLSDNLFAYHIS